jgi:hypothetical protein
LYDTEVHRRLYPSFPREVGIPSRVLVNSRKEFIKTVTRFNGRTDVYASVYSADLTVDKLFYDFDGASAVREATEFFNFLTSKNLTVIPVHSGKRGVHLYVLLHPSPPDKDLLLSVMRGLVEDCFGRETPSSLDFHTIGNLRQLARVPNTLRVGFGTYCVPLPPNWTDFRRDELLDYIKSPKTEVKIEVKKFPKLEDFGYKKEVKKVREVETFKVKLVNGEFFRQILRPCLWNRLHEPEPSHDVRVASTIDLINSGVSPDEILRFFSTLGWRDFDIEDTRYQIQHIASRKYHSYSCKRLRELKIPTRGCCLG